MAGFSKGNGSKKLTKQAAEDAISGLESENTSTKELLLNLLNKNLIELYCSLTNPKEVKVGLTEPGVKVLANGNSKT